MHPSLNTQTSLLCVCLRVFIILFFPSLSFFLSFFFFPRCLVCFIHRAEKIVFFFNNPILTKPMLISISICLCCLLLGMDRQFYHLECLYVRRGRACCHHPRLYLDAGYHITQCVSVALRMLVCDVQLCVNNCVVCLLASDFGNTYWCIICILSGGCLFYLYFSCV